MNVPPFPSQDLAKLVLGYLAEEQLMTAYDEFLQASPYLDALRNEYDRIFMTSLKSILAEYRAVKIFVETCKPFILRKRLFQCQNLLEIVKFLINNVDINKLQLLEAADKASYEKQNVSKPCDVCNSLKLNTCVCKSRQNNSSVSQSYNAEGSVPQTSTEATPLSDLPGNYVTTRKKQAKTLEREITTISNSSVVQHSDCSIKESLSSNTSQHSVSLYQSSHTTSNDITAASLNTTVKPTELLDSRQKLEEFNDVLKSVVKRNSTISGSEVISNEKVSNANTFNEFASGVTGADSQSANVPDSSTSENQNVQCNTKDYYNDNIKGPPNRLLLQVSHVNDAIDISTYRGVPPKLPKLLPKPDDQKIKILSDVKVINKTDKIKDGKMKPVHFKNATSTPLMQMQTIVINGTPAYTNKSMNTHTYTKDEIMAMPTLIVVPPTGSAKNPKKSQIKTTSVTSESCTIVSNDVSSPSSVLGPLVIDVPTSPQQYTRPSAGLPDINNHNPPASNLIKTVDVFKNASVPKDTGSTSTSTVTTNTPQGLAPMRKSSSTPRRTSSHVRVLDFTTPRRILHETINEQLPSETAPTSVEIVLSSSNFTQTLTTTNAVTTTETTVINYNNVSSVQNIEGINIIDTSKKVNIVKAKQKRDWDADLRALVVASSEPPKSTPKNVPKKQKIDKTSESNKDKKSRKLNSPKAKKTKKRRKVIEIEDDSPPDENVKFTIPIKPTINVISAQTGNKIVDSVAQNNNENNTNKPNEKEDDLTNTPDGDRLLLQNVIGAKLNISDLLETPYKQALYDIQMETPRFLGPDLPDDPMSDIKIMNIPTPRFLNTPKVVQATPSSYSSRPTDYSSGGSYYKPDEQDYIVITDLACPVTSSKEATNVNKAENECATKKSRPVRQCTKNVSYYTSSGAVRTKNVEDNSDSSSCSELIDGSSIINDTKTEKLNTVKTPSNNKSKSRILIDSNKKSTVRSRKPPKEKAKTFIKIKPRQTPTKLTPAGKMRKRISDNSKYTSPNKLARKRTTSKEKNVSVEPLIVCAPTKSRRKSSTPRKLHCTKTFNSGNFTTNSPIINKQEISSLTSKIENQDNLISASEMQKQSSQDSDTEQLALRWSDDGSQDAKGKVHQSNVTANSSEDISQIKQYIETTELKTMPKPTLRKDGDGSLQADLIKRGFDVETAKIIERDLLDMPSHSKTPPQFSVEIVETKESSLEKTSETDASCSNELQIVQNENEDDDPVEFSVHECNEYTNNYFTYQYDDREITPVSLVPLKDNFSMEICIDELTVRLRANQFTTLLDQDPRTEEEAAYNSEEVEMAVSSISNMDRLYTPLKQSVKAQCIEIFDSTLTSIDTPLKVNSPKRGDNDATVTEIVLEEEKGESKDKADVKKRKRSVPDDSLVDTKKPKHDTQYLLASTNIQNIDIESVLKKLHGP